MSEEKNPIEQAISSSQGEAIVDQRGKSAKVKNKGEPSNPSYKHLTPLQVAKLVNWLLVVENQVKLAEMNVQRAVYVTEALGFNFSSSQMAYYLRSLEISLPKARELDMASLERLVESLETELARERMKTRALANYMLKLHDMVFPTAARPEGLITIANGE